MSLPLPLRPSPVPGSNGRLHCAFTVDVEDWFQSSVDHTAPITDRILWNMENLLTILEAHHVKATFFVQGGVARRFPRLVRDLVAAGHEIQSHGHTHYPLYRMDRRALQTELDNARKAVEDACGKAVWMFRAPDFSILKGNLWALEELRAAGFLVDSSIFPMRMRRYGIAGWDLRPRFVQSGGNGVGIWEVPVAVQSIGGYRFPVAGGGYMRLWPAGLMAAGLRSILKQGRPVVLYCHPYDFNARELGHYLGRTSATFFLCQRVGRARLARKVGHIFEALPFGRLDAVLANWGIHPPEVGRTTPEPAPMAAAARARPKADLVPISS